MAKHLTGQTCASAECGMMLSMTTLLSQAIEKLSQLPKERQDELAKMLIDVAAQDLSPYQLTDEERKDVEAALKEVERGEFATEEQMAALWKKCGL